MHLNIGKNFLGVELHRNDTPWNPEAVQALCVSLTVMYTHLQVTFSMKLHQIRNVITTVKLTSGCS